MNRSPIDVVVTFGFLVALNTSPGAPKPVGRPSLRLPPSVTRVLRVDAFAPYRDPGATNYQPNIATRSAASGGEYWELIAPTLRAHATAPSASGGTPGSATVPSTAPPSAWRPAGPFTITWEVATSAPLDHVDLRIKRWESTVTDVVHFIEFPRTSDGQFPMGTTFDPLTQDNVPPGPSGPAFVTYTVEAVAVDTKGRASAVSCDEVDLRFGEGHAGSGLDVVALEPTPFPACFPNLDLDAPDPFDDLPPRRIEISYYTYDGGQTATMFRPSELVVHSASGNLTMVNHDVYPHHLQAVFTRPYSDAPVGSGLSIGGVALLDFGHLDPNQSRTIPMPPGVPDHYVWNLYDFEDPTPYHKHIQIRVFNTGEDNGGGGGIPSGLPALPASVLNYSKSLSGKFTAGQLKGVETAKTALMDRILVKGEDAHPAVVARDELKSALGNLSGLDIDSMVQLVMMEAAQDSQKDMKDMLDQMQQEQERKKALRDLISAAHARADELKMKLQTRPPRASRKATESKTVEIVPAQGLLLPAVQLPAVQYTKDAIGKLSVADLQKAIDDLQSDLDSMNELSEMTSLRLQMMMDRRSKFITTLSNIMKKIDTTSETIVQNMK